MSTKLNFLETYLGQEHQPSVFAIHLFIGRLVVFILFLLIFNVSWLLSCVLPIGYSNDEVFSNDK